MKRIMVDMSATLIHHGHIRLIEKASQYGSVVIGLTRDSEILSQKGYMPELAYEHRKEILQSLELVHEVVETPWLLTNEVLKEFEIDLLVHGDDNSNPIDDGKLLVLPRTEGISSSNMRVKALESMVSINNRKLMLTPGPAAVLAENVVNIKPLFGRGDNDYDVISEAVLKWVGKISGQDEVVAIQGSATFGLELAAHSFVQGKVLLIVTGYYSERLVKLLPKNCDLSICTYDELENVTGHYDWVMCAYTETSHAFKLDLKKVKDRCVVLGAKLYVDATGSIGLEEDHHLCDVTAFSSCKGLFGITGACFIAHKKELSITPSEQFYFNLDTHKNKMVTGPYHAMASLYGVIDIHQKLVSRVKASKEMVLNEFKDFIPRENNQPLLCTYLNGTVSCNDNNIVKYTPRSNLPGSVICHFGEIHKDSVEVVNRISLKRLS